MKKEFSIAIFALVGFMTVFSQEFSFSLKLEQAVINDFSLSQFNAMNLGSTTSANLAFRMIHDRFSLEGSGSATLLYGTSAQNLFAASALGKNQFLEVIFPAVSGHDQTPSLALDFRLAAFFTSFASDNFKFEAGLSPINWGTGKIFSPADLFARFRSIGLSAEREAEIMLRSLWYPSPTSVVEAVCIPYLPYPLEKAGMAIGTRLYTVLFNTLGTGLQAAWYSAHGSEPARISAALESQTDLWFITPSIEAKLTIPLDNVQKPVWQMMGGCSIPFNTVSAYAEYLYDPASATRHSIFASLSWKADEWITISMPVFVYPESGYFQSGLSISGVQVCAAELTCSAFLRHFSSENYNIQISTYLIKKF